MTNTHALSRRIVAALDPDGTKWPKWHRNDASDGSLMLCTNVPDLAAPENLYPLIDVADALGRWALEFDREYVCKLKGDGFCKFGYVQTRSLAVLAAVCAALGIDTTQEDEE